MFGLLRRTAPSHTPGEVHTVLDGLKDNRCPTPEAIRVLLEHREASVPALRVLLDEAVRWKRVPAEPCTAPIHAVFLLAALESPEGLEPLVRWLRKPRGFVEALFGDLVTECLSWALTRLAKRRPEALVGLARDPFLDPYVRSAAMRGLVGQALLWPERRAEVITRGMRLLDEAPDDPDPQWPSLLVSDLTDLASPELRSRLETLCKDDVVDPQCIDQDEIDRAYRQPRRDVTETMDVYRLYRTHRSLLGWGDPEVEAEREASERSDEDLEDDDSLPADETAQRPTSSVKVGRNRPCPCGSGVKYKKCCLSASSETVLSHLLTALGSAMTMEQLTAEIRAAIDANSPTTPPQVIERVLRSARADGSSVTFDSDAQAALFLAHVTALWNTLARQPG
mgnify:CR=1 FL=1